MNKRKSVKKLFNKSGLTYVELLVALALLALIVVCFTPMLLTSYESLYKAGEKTEAVYNSQQQMEEGLAVRSSTTTTDLAINFKKNTETVFENIQVTGRKIVSTLQDGLETIFYGVRARIDIISSDTVNDDSTTHEVILQTTGLAYDSVKKFTDYSGNLDDMPENLILIDARIPNKQTGNGTTTDELVYANANSANVKIFPSSPAKGRINFTVSGADFTQSPIKIIIYYKNERGYTKQLVDYLFIEPPTIIAAGSSGMHDYYTTAGVQHVDASGDGEVQQTEYVFTLEGRTMRLANSGLLKQSDSPKSTGTQINTITWVGQDENRLVKPYYVMAGTNASVYRMYRYDSMDLTPQSVLGASNSVTNTTDNPYDLSDGRRVYQDFWSGEMSDYYYFLTQETANGYGTYDDNRKDCSEGTSYNYIGKNLNYTMLFAGYNTGYEYAHQANRRISYVLTEAGNKSFRLAGKKKAANQFNGYTGYWENSNDYILFIGGNKIFGIYTTYNTTDERVVYLTNDSGIGDIAAANAHYDKNLAYLRLKSFTNINPFTHAKGSHIYENNWNKGDFWYPVNTSEEGDLGGCEPNSDYSWLKDYSTYASITSCAYLPGAGSNGQGQVVYFGSTAAYAFLRQSADIGTTSDATKVYNNDKCKDARATVYVIMGTSGVGTTVIKGYGVNDNDAKPVSNKVRDAGYNIGSIALKTDATDFYKSCNDVVYKYNESDLAFTLGYCSRWRMAMGDVTSNGTQEETRSYEKYYLASHTTGTYNRKPSINQGGTENLYYNVWFPGEFYNLTETATCDEVTVAVGYTVSGSSFMKESAAVGSGYYGTALGGLFNDGVLAAYTSADAYRYNLDASKGGQTTIFKNLLYYKSSSFINNELHSRANIRFEKVSLNAETTKISDTTGTKNYYAYFSDNNGKVYRVLVATANVSATGSGDSASASETVTLRTVRDTELASSEIKVNGQPVNYYFTDIVSIDAKDEIVIITGTPASGHGKNIFLVATKDSAGNWNWKVVYFLPEFGGLPLTAAFSVGGYYYLGVNAGEGYVAAINMETLRAAGNGAVLWAGTYDEATNTCSSPNVDHILYARAGDQIYAIGGRETN